MLSLTAPLLQQSTHKPCSPITHRLDLGLIKRLRVAAGRLPAPPPPQGLHELRLYVGQRALHVVPDDVRGCA